MRNIRLRLQYEGTRYQGWQKQTSTDNTIQGKMETLLTKMCGEPIEISASGRTDAGVHALGQVANFHTEASMSVPLRYNNDKQKKPLFSRGLSVCRLLFNSFSKLKIDENYKEKRRLFY